MVAFKSILTLFLLGAIVVGALLLWAWLTKKFPWIKDFF